MLDSLTAPCLVCKCEYATYTVYGRCGQYGHMVHTLAGAAGVPVRGLYGPKRSCRV